jgi:BirA family biotin operon repressor/biotin-[acetyl-CoA-carboxylase] ligase
MAVSIAGSLDPAPLLALLADGQPHSGEWLAQRLGVNRTAVRKAVLRLRDRGVEAGAVRGCGYALAGRVELLDARAIRAVLSEAHAGRVHGLEIAFEVDSTNTRLLAAAPPPAGGALVLLSELQTAGRGRRGRRWAAPFGGSIALSMAWSFGDRAKVSPALSLCAGVAVCRALARAGAAGIGVKWPNDLWLNDRKVGGVLLELRADAGGPAQVVIGIGLNVALTRAARAEIEASGAAVAAIADACSGVPSRNFIAGAIIDELLSMLVDFEREGFSAWREAWSGLDVLRDRPAQVMLDEAIVRGTARGVDAQGRLQLEREGRMQTFVSGEVSLRLGEAKLTDIE